MSDPLVDALKTIADGSMKSDRSLLNLVNTLIDRFKELEERVQLLEDIQKAELKASIVSRSGRNVPGGQE
jgi:hypothetical protein